VELFVKVAGGYQVRSRRSFASGCASEYPRRTAGGTVAM
jgi:hypothetical protein